MKDIIRDIRSILYACDLRCVVGATRCACYLQHTIGMTNFVMARLICVGTLVILLFSGENVEHIVTWVLFSFGYIVCSSRLEMEWRETSDRGLFWLNELFFILRPLRIISLFLTCVFACVLIIMSGMFSSFITIFSITLVLYFVSVTPLPPDTVGFLEKYIKKKVHRTHHVPDVT